jgi:hypothetical protein
MYLPIYLPPTNGKVRTVLYRTYQYLTSIFVDFLQECHTLYTDPDHGLVSIAETLNLKLLAPRKKITIMLIGKVISYVFQNYWYTNNSNVI